MNYIISSVIGVISLFGIIACIITMLARSSKNISLSLDNHDLSKNDN